MISCSMGETDIITLSSSDEDDLLEPPTKRIKKCFTEVPAVQNMNQDVICLDSDNESTDIDKDSVDCSNKEHVDELKFKKDEGIENDHKIHESAQILGNEVDENKNRNETEESAIAIQSDDLFKSKEHNSKDASDNDDSKEDMPLKDESVKECREMSEFLQVCKVQVTGTKFEQGLLGKYPMMLKVFNALSTEYLNSDHMNNFLLEQISRANTSVTTAIVSFKDVYQQFKSILDSESIDLNPEDIIKVKKLEKFMKKLISRIKKLEKSEVNFDTDDSDSAYIQQDRYMQRLTKVYTKYCRIMKKNPFSGRLTHDKLDFVSSNFGEINLAINKKYKNNSKFPSFDELDSYIQQVVEDKEISMNTQERHVESKHCFRKLGDLLQLRRKKELYEAHCSYILDQEDPAIKDKTLNELLRSSAKEGRIKIENLCQEYVRRQELGSYQCQNDVIDIKSTSEKDNSSTDTE